MSDRIAKAYSNFLKYEEMKNKNKSSVPDTPTRGLLARKGVQRQMGDSNSSQYAELEKVASYVDNIRKYRTL